jgi:Glycosyl hydrolase family 26
MLTPARASRWSAAVVGLTALLTLAAPAQAAQQIYLGAIGDVAGLSAGTGAPLATHAYAHFDGAVPAGRMISVRARTTWSEVAAAAPGSPVYDDIVRWAQTLRARGTEVLLAYHHEPEGSVSAGYGTAAQFIAAYRRVVTIFRQQGATNVRFVWQMTEWAFRTNPADSHYAGAWYPGDDVVDNVGGDVYNWFDCGPGRGRWVELATMTDPVIAFARAHGKTASLPEFGVDPDPRRPQWLANAHAYLVAHADVLTAAFYFQHPPTHPANQDCSFPLTSPADLNAFADLGRDPAFRT